MIEVSLFSPMLRVIPRDKFDRFVSKQASDKHQKGINSRTHLVAMLFCYIGGAASLRDISNGWASTRNNPFYKPTRHAKKRDKCVEAMDKGGATKKMLGSLKSLIF